MAKEPTTIEAAPEILPEILKEAPKKKRRKKGELSLKRGIVHVNASYNNTIITITDTAGNAVAWHSAGRAGFKGPKKSTPYAAGVVVRRLADFVRAAGLQQVDVAVSGIGMGRDSAIRALSGIGLQIGSIKDKTPAPHNGPRQKKPRRA